MFCRILKFLGLLATGLVAAACSIESGPRTRALPLERRAATQDANNKQDSTKGSGETSPLPTASATPTPTPTTSPIKQSPWPGNRPPDTELACTTGQAAINGTCQTLVAVHRCRSNTNTTYYANHIYPTDLNECTSAGYIAEATPYFHALANGDKQIYRWLRKTPLKDILHYYLQPDENPPAPYTKEGPAWKLLASDFNHANKTPIYRCVISCAAAFPGQANCDANMQWLSLKADCENKGVNAGVIGYGILP